MEHRTVQQLEDKIAELKEERLLLENTAAELDHSLIVVRGRQSTIRYHLSEALASLTNKRLGVDNLAEAFKHAHKQLEDKHMRASGTSGYINISNIYGELVHLVANENDAIHNDTLIAAYVIEHPELGQTNQICMESAAEYNELREIILKQTGLEDRWNLHTVEN